MYHSPDRSTAPPRRRPFVVGWLLWLSLAPSVVGCRGCSSDPLTEEEREAKREELKKKEQEKPPFEFLRFAVQPGGVEETQQKRPEVFIKPGHWTNATLRSRANNFDFRGELLSESLDMTARPVPLDEVPYQLRTTRPVILPKGQQRLLEFSVLMPVETRSKNISTRLLRGVGGTPVFGENQPITSMPPHQYYLVVLALNAQSYSFLKKLPSVTAPSESIFEPLQAAHYRVALPQIKTVAPVPSQTLGWTSIAYVIWDDLEPKKLSPEQQQAMLDWLHWGGQLIVSGPDTLATLKGSFLEEFLPASAGDTWQIKPEALEPLNATWQRGERALKAVRGWSGVHLKLAEGASTVVASGNEPLVVERRTGRGRIVLSAFRLSQRELHQWPSFDNFFNSCLLRRPPRTFRVNNETLSVAWRDGHKPRDPNRISQVRYFTRDVETKNDVLADLMRERANPNPQSVDELNQAMQYSQATRFNQLGVPAQEADIEQPTYGSGPAGWNDFSAASNIALDTLRRAAGITVPDARFVVTVLGAYILVLVPLNWGFFRVLGRVEWAWAAAPVISLGGALAVVYLAQLDIGFARSKSELAVLEVQGKYPRGHLTRYLALYSSLGTRYQLRFDDQSATALPFAAGQRRVIGQSVSTVDYRRTPQISEEDQDEVAQVTLDGLEISSNTTGMVHSEEMLDAGGGFGWQPLGQSLGGNRYRLTNDTRFALAGVAIVGLRHTAWVGSIGAGAAVTVELVERPNNPADLWDDQLDKSPVTTKGVTDGLNLRNMYRLVENRAAEEGRADDLCVVGWTDDELAGLSIRPSASQSRQLTLVVGHIDFGASPVTGSDENSAFLAYQAAGRLPPPEEDEEEK